MTHAFRKGERVKSISNGFTGGRVGVIQSFGAGDEPVAFVKFDADGAVFAVALRLLVYAKAQ